MSLLNLPRRLTELGRIRIGHRVPTGKGDKTRPEKLETFRLTSRSHYLLQVAAGVYGGELREWEGAPTDAPQWELYTDSDALPIIVPPDRSLTQYMEMWSGGGCKRRCDGETELLSDSPCACPSEAEQRRELAANGKACKPTTRLNVMLPDLEGLGVWRLETHGYWAAVELAGTASLLARASHHGQLIPAVLRLEQRDEKRPGQPPRHYGVPVIEIRQRLGDLLAPALEGNSSAEVTHAARPELTSSVHASEADAAPVPVADANGDTPLMSAIKAKGSRRRAEPPTADAEDSATGGTGEAPPAAGDMPDWLAEGLAKVGKPPEWARQVLVDAGFKFLATATEPAQFSQIADADVPAARQALRDAWNAEKESE